MSGSFAPLIILRLVLDLYDGLVRMANFLVIGLNFSARTVLDVHDIILRLVSHPWLRRATGLSIDDPASPRSGSDTLLVIRMRRRTNPSDIAMSIGSIVI